MADYMDSGDIHPRYRATFKNFVMQLPLFPCTPKGVMRALAWSPLPNLRMELGQHKAFSGVSRLSLLFCLFAYFMTNSNLVCRWDFVLPPRRDVHLGDDSFSRMDQTVDGRRGLFQRQNSSSSSHEVCWGHI